ncbi:hypothetical protein F5Y06DRAFT_273355 [Hypoxylon sp. FL0890]|nr:hypothetical protein F5Y06DRAFT_273355 [Hypoxylon sp. FL0890]
MSSSESRGIIAKADTEEDDKALHSAIENVKAIYKAGTPLFTKAAIRRLAEDLDAFTKGELEDNQIVLPSLDGNDVRYTISPGFSSGIMYRPRIDYRPYEYLIYDGSLWSPRFRYLPLHVCYMDIPQEHDPAHTTEDVSRLFDSKRKEWESSEHHAQVQRLLASVKIPSDIKKVIGFALGSLVLNRARPRCMIQHSILLSIHEWASAIMEGKTKPQCYAQDPVYTDQEKEVLETRGVTVLEDPKGFLEADESSIVLTISPNVPVRQIITEISRPAMIIWDRPQVYPGTRTTDPVSPRVIDMLSKQYTAFDFPYHEATTNLVLYVRNDSFQSKFPESCA